MRITNCIGGMPTNTRCDEDNFHPHEKNTPSHDSHFLKATRNSNFHIIAETAN